MTDKNENTLSRRRFFAASSAAALSVGTATSVRAAESSDGKMVYEITRTEEEWLAMLDTFDYFILRKGKTEEPKSSELWDLTEPGTYHCKGCDLKSFDGRWKTVLDKGWVFFFHSEPDAVLMSIDGPTPEYGQMTAGKKAIPEVHCRRCGSHLGHFLIVEGKMTHCINGAALNFKPVSA